MFGLFLLNIFGICNLFIGPQYGLLVSSSVAIPEASIWFIPSEDGDDEDDDGNDEDDNADNDDVDDDDDDDDEDDDLIDIFLFDSSLLYLCIKENYRWNIYIWNNNDNTNNIEKCAVGVFHSFSYCS